jgi:small subunit ribosomal protein S17e
MGSIRQTYIKSTTDALLRTYPNEFSTDFNENKKKVASFSSVQSKSLRNRVAGYVTRKLASKGRKR